MRADRRQQPPPILLTAQTHDCQAARVRAIHQNITGDRSGRRPYATSDPHLLTWVHIAEADSFVRAHARFGSRRWTRPDATVTSPT
jgi:uncharacterized protein (DUF2236 family)